MSKHTPGPWEQVGNLIRTEFAGEGGWLVAACEHSLPQHEANARLIAAAPDLLEACMLARHICEDGNALQQQLDAAIAKATGAGHE